MPFSQCFQYAEYIFEAYFTLKINLKEEKAKNGTILKS